MRAPRLVAVGAAICLALLPVAGAHADTPQPFTALKKAFRKALKSKDPKVRSGAFDLLKDSRNPHVVAEIIYGVDLTYGELERIGETQEASHAEMVALQNKLARLQTDFDKSDKGSEAMASYNKKARKIAKAQDEARSGIEALENEWTRTRGLIQRGCNVMARVLRKLPDDVLETALIDLDTLWLHADPKRKPNGAQYWLDAVREVNRRPITDALHIVVDDAQAPMATRVAVIGALAERDDGEMLRKAIEMLDLDMAEAPLITAAIYAIRQMHDKRGIRPLIDFLKRHDLRRLREDAHVALLSLTGQERIGPYYEPWNEWFREAGPAFQMPKSPMPPGIPLDEREGVTFYGIHTFSDRVLFIVDISASMRWALEGPRGQIAGR